MHFRKYRFRKTWLDKRLKRHVSGDPLTHNMVNGSKHCCNLKESTFSIFTYVCERNCLGKSLF